MSNVIKSVYFNVDTGQKKIIDSDSRVEQFIPEIYTKESQPEESFAFPPMEAAQEDADGTFQDGLSVIHMDDVLAQERQKMSREISQNLIEETEQQTAKLLEEAKAEAEQIVARAKDEAEVIRSQAQSEGREAGRQQGMAEAEANLQQMRAQCQEEYDRKERELVEQERQMEPFFADLTAGLVEKITGIVCEDKKEVILYLIEQAVRHLEKPKQITLRVSKGDMAEVSMHKAQLKETVPDVETFDVVEDASLAASQCIIETENKIIDCSLDVQLQSLREQIRMLAL